MTIDVIIDYLNPLDYIESTVFIGDYEIYNAGFVEIYYYSSEEVWYSELYFYLDTLMLYNSFSIDDITNLTLRIHNNEFDSDDVFQLQDDSGSFVTLCAINDEYFIIPLTLLLDTYDDTIGAIHFYLYPEGQTYEWIGFYIQQIEISLILGGAN